MPINPFFFVLFAVPARQKQDLEYEFYEAVLRDTAGSAATAETVWVVGEFDEDDLLFRRLQQDHGNVKKAVSG